MTEDKSGSVDVRLRDRRRRAKRSGQLWRHLRAAMRLVLRHPLPSVVVVPIRSDGTVVLVRRVDTDRWVLPGGLIDWGETVEEAARRELQEETGFEVARVGRLVGVYSWPERDPRSHSIAIAIAADVRGNAEIGDPLEISEIHAFTQDTLPFGYMSYGTETMLRDCLENRTVVA
ncbi:NUDIX hydrolase [soil metagenome]